MLIILLSLLRLCSYWLYLILIKCNFSFHRKEAELFLVSCYVVFFYQNSEDCVSVCFL